MTAPQNPTLHSLNRFIASLGELTPEGEVRAEVCRGLAQRIDSTRESKTGASSVAHGQLAARLEASINGLLDATPAKADPFLSSLGIGPAGPFPVAVAGGA